MGRLGLAAAIGGPAIARITSRSAVGDSGTTADVRVGSQTRLFELIVNGVIAAGWLSERSSLFSRPLDPVARAAVRFKDVLIAGTLLTGAASVAGEKFLRREHPDGLPITRDAQLATQAPPSADPYRRYFRVLGIANRGLRWRRRRHSLHQLRPL